MAIVIIADDLSGAAEMAGIAFARELSAEVQRLRFDAASGAEVIAVDTDSRGLTPERAAVRIREAASAVVAARPAAIFKKVDSVLRGNVQAEVEALLGVTGQARALLVPANPTRGRTIEGGRLLIGGVPLDQTEFGIDPEHPRRSADVRDLLGLKNSLASVFQLPDVPSLEAVQRLAADVESDTLPAGAADFFAALLDARQVRVAQTHHLPMEPRLELPTLLVCGSRASWDRRAADCAAAGIPLQTFAAASSGGRLPDTDMNGWANRAASRLALAGRLLLGVGPFETAVEPAELVRRLAELTALVLQRTPVKTLLLEGGATAEAVAHRLDWHRLEVSSAAPAGIGILQPLDTMAPQVWIKPGSYPWPDAIWRSNSPHGPRGPQ